MMETRTSRRVSLRKRTRTAEDQAEANKNNADSELLYQGVEEKDSKPSTKRSSYNYTPSKVPLPGLAQTSAGDTLGTATPLQTRGLDLLKQRIEEELSKPLGPAPDNTSPGLARLRNTPGRGLKERQRELIEKHEQIRQNSDKLNVGGGVTLWPNMNQMRLSQREIIFLIIICLGLVAITGWLFVLLHGEMIQNMWKLTAQLQSFSQTHPIRNTGFQQDLKSSVLAWHSDFRQLLDGADKMLNVRCPSAGYQLYILAYMFGFGVLVYFLVDNMFSKSKLSPGRIKKWVCLLVVVGQWTAMLFVMFIYAQHAESAVISNVLQLSEKLGDLIAHDFDLDLLNTVTQYWRGRCLPPAAQGVVRILGLVSVQDVTVYLQYYSLPVATVLFTPIIRLCLAVKSVYASSKKL